MLDYLGIENCAITKLPDYSNIHAELTPVTVTEQEVQEYVDEILEDYGKKALTTEFVKEKFEVDSIEEYYQKVREELKTSKEVEETTALRNNIMKTSKIRILQSLGCCCLLIVLAQVKSKRSIK